MPRQSLIWVSLKIGGRQVDLPLNNDYPARAIFNSTLSGSEIRRKKKSAHGQHEEVFWFSD
jgi:hypothetical protein